MKKFEMPKIYEVPEERNYWVIRADGGRYFRHFMEYNLIAIGHLDILGLKDHGDTPFSPSKVEIGRAKAEEHKKRDINKGTTTSHINQVACFVRKMKIGDWVMAIGGTSVCLGRVTGHPRLRTTPLEIVYGKKERKIEMPHNLRRSVSWGPIINRDTLPYDFF